MNIKKLNMENAGSFENWHKGNNSFRQPAGLNFVDLWFLRRFTDHQVYLGSMGMTAKARRIIDRLQWWWYMQDGGFIVAVMIFSITASTIESIVDKFFTFFGM